MASLLGLSGRRFQVVYRICGTLDEVRNRAREISVEQTVEFPEALLPAGDIRDQLVGHIESITPLDESRHEVAISYAVETAGFEFTQLLNVIFGNTSMQPGIRVERIVMPEVLLQAFSGPRFGCRGLRDYLGVTQRPLLCTALKPMGLSATELAELAYTLALGGIDIIKDDHGLADQPFAPFHERVARCAEAVSRANRITGLKCIYAPNVSGCGEETLRRAYSARQLGAGALLIAPGLVSFGMMQQIASDERIGLPILGHPALLGSFAVHPDYGISHYTIFGQLMRLAGADATIFPNYGGRFSFSQKACKAIAQAASEPMGRLRSIFPAPAGGMTIERVPEMRTVYGNDVILLIGGGLHTHSPDLLANCREFRRLVEHGL
ncbi:MAG: RuBisCO large subunit C-terminal-like domain-containing protein [Anaerolineae bacterium]|nr:RuBisCO large subunit C-terminal-like domain-containing protein [Candidatus Roseilinea sp.]MDW8451415.1 RuBisCO large subunit C-terminal-like domain-containing protein [Anaerolineae bacterium]